MENLKICIKQQFSNETGHTELKKQSIYTQITASSFPAGVTPCIYIVYWKQEDNR